MRQEEHHGTPMTLLDAQKTTNGQISIIGTSDTSSGTISMRPTKTSGPRTLMHGTLLEGGMQFTITEDWEMELLVEEESTSPLEWSKGQDKGGL